MLLLADTVFVVSPHINQEWQSLSKHTSLQCFLYAVDKLRMKKVEGGTDDMSKSHATVALDLRTMCVRMR